LADGSLAYVVRRFARPDGGGKLRQEDFCQYATEPVVESLKLFRQMACCWWTGNGDMHLKNFSLVTGLDGTVRLSPAYDLLCTRLVIPDDQFALPVGGKRDGLSRQHWEEYGACCGLPPRAVRRELDRIATSPDRAVDLVSRSPLGEPSRTRDIELLRARTALFSAGSTP